MSKLYLSAKVAGPPYVKFVASLSESFTAPVRSALVAVDGNGIAKGVVEGLTPGSLYYIGVENVDEVLSTLLIGRARTPAVGAHSFNFGFASCSDTASNALVFDAIKARADSGNLAFFFHLGDLHYEDIATNSEALFHAAIDSSFAQAKQKALWSSISMPYIWDDHDFGPNDSDSTSPSRAAAIAFFRNRVPAPVVNPTGSNGCYYSFIRGRVRFVVTDVRSERSVKSATDNSSKVMFSATQKAWFFAELLAAAAAAQAIIWANTFPWVGASSAGNDAWFGYTNARTEVANFITTNGLSDRIAIISGDMHSLAYDDGSSANNPAGLVVCHAAALDQLGSNKGGPYTAGPIRTPASGDVSQFGVLEVADTGASTIAFRFRGISVNRSTGAETEEINRTFTLEAG